MRLRAVVLADFTVSIGTGRIEVAQRRPLQSVRRAVPVQHLFDEQLGLAVRVHGPLWVIFGDWHHIGNAIGGTGRGEHDAPHVRLMHGIQQIQGAGDVIAEILARIRHRLAHIGEGGEVDHGVDGILAQSALDRGAVRQIGLDQRAPAHGPAMAIDQAVEADGGIPCSGEGLAGVAADVSGATSDQNIAVFHSVSGELVPDGEAALL